MYARSSEVQSFIMNRHNEMAQDNNPQFAGHFITHNVREVKVTFRYVKTFADGMGMDQKTFDGRKWS